MFQMTHVAWTCATLLFVLGHASSNGTVAAQDSRLYGGWTLDRDASSAVPAESDDSPPQLPAGGRGRQGRGFPPAGGTDGGRGRGERAGDVDPETMRKAMVLTRELSTPSAHLVLSEIDGAIKIEDERGRSARYTPNNKKEKHQLTGGTVETSTRWDGDALRQEFRVDNIVLVERIYAVSKETGRLVVTTNRRGARSGGGERPLQFVYDMDR